MTRFVLCVIAPAVTLSAFFGWPGAVLYVLGIAGGEVCAYLGRP